MSCSHPLKRFLIGTNPDTGKSDGIVTSYSVDHLEFFDGRYVAVSIPEQNKPLSICYRDYQEIPCGKCMECKLSYSREWADRMLMEYSVTKKAIFLTLTYRDDVIPRKGEFYNLEKKDLQDFLKRLRFYFSDVRGIKNLRFYGCGEYGEKYHRCHFHLIIFGIDLDDLKDIEFHHQSILGFKYYISPEMEKLWPYGFCPVSNYSWKTGAYVSRYVTKKINDDKIFYEALNLNPPFATMSLKPGIGFEFLDSHKKEYLETNKLYLRDGDNSNQVGLPRYLKNKLEVEFPELWSQRKQELQDVAKARVSYEMAHTDLDRMTYLANKEAAKMSSLKKLRLTEFE